MGPYGLFSIQTHLFGIDIMTFFTSLLPVSVGKTDFLMKAPEWKPSGVARAQPLPTWRLLDGPPYANGALHMGHVRNKLLKDTLARAAQADGHTVSWRAGWDCHGLPVERNVEALGVSRDNPREFLAAARTYAHEQTLAQKGQFQTLGLSCDMEDAYRTMDFKQQADTLRVFARMVENGNVYRAYRPVAWCHECQSTVANAECEPAMLTTSDLYFFVKLSDGNFACVWTTQAWSLYGHDALLVNPTARYGLYRLRREGVEDTRDVWLSTQAMENVRDLGAYTLEFLGKLVDGQDLVGLTYSMEWTGRSHEVAAHAGVQDAAGTGWLHASAACAEDDFSMLKEVGVESQSLVNQPMNPDGRMPAANNEFYWVAHANAVKAAVLDSWCHAVRVKREKDHCWRHKVALTVRPSAQWYVRLDAAVKDRAAQRVAQVAFVPESGRARLLDAVMNRPDWCVSRQRTWGVPLCLYADTNGRVAPFSQEAMKEFAAAVQVGGTAAVLDAPRERDGYTLCMDVLDVWFDSGACFLSTMDDTPDLVVEGHDQFRGWFQSSLLVSAVLDERLPYRQVVAHGFVLAKAGEKLSKSAGNEAKASTQKGAAPAWETVHPDVLRVWSNHGEVGNDKFWNAASFDNAVALYQKWRNTLRFLLANLPDEQPAFGAEAYWWPAERWTVHQSRTARARVVALLREGNTDMAVEAMHAWCQQLSNHSFMMVKDRLYCGNADERAAVHVLLCEVLRDMGDVMQCLLPCTWNEAQAFLPAWWGMGPERTGEVVVDVSWNAWYAMREAVAVLWSAHSVKGKGSLVWADVRVREMPSFVLHDEALQWLGVSGLEVTDNGSDNLAVGVLDGALCERCRMVSKYECVFCAGRAGRAHDHAVVELQARG